MADRYEVSDDETEIEQRRLRLLAEARDPWTRATIDSLGTAVGWRCLEIGAGAGSISNYLGERVGPHGSVVATDIDTRFHEPPIANVTLLHHDVVRDPAPGRDFDVIHARAVLQHLPERETVLARLIEWLRPGGWLLIEETDVRAFVEQPLPEPYGTVHRLMNDPAFTPWREPNFGTRLAALLGDRGLVDIDVEGQAWAMRPGEPGGDWWFLAVQRTLPRLLAAGVIDDVAAASVRDTIADPSLVIVSPLSLAIRARRPALD